MILRALGTRGGPCCLLVVSSGVAASATLWWWCECAVVGAAEHLEGWPAVVTRTQSASFVPGQGWLSGEIGISLQGRGGSAARSASRERLAHQPLFDRPPLIVGLWPVRRGGRARPHVVALR